MSDIAQQDGWSQYEKLVLENLKELKESTIENTKAIQTLNINYATMKAEASRDAKWISGIGVVISALLGSGVHFFWKR